MLSSLFLCLQPRHHRGFVSLREPDREAEPRRSSLAFVPILEVLEPRPEERPRPRGPVAGIKLVLRRTAGQERRHLIDEVERARDRDDLLVEDHDAGLCPPVDRCPRDDVLLPGVRDRHPPPPVLAGSERLEDARLLSLARVAVGPRAVRVLDHPM
jgi:hypothetical protein